MDALAGGGSCTENGCAGTAVVRFGGHDLCLDHFAARCYKRLDELEPMIRNRLLDYGQVNAARALLEECSSRTLLLSLRHEALTNLDRSRLLEILLHCGDLQFILRNRSLEFRKGAVRRPVFITQRDLPQREAARQPKIIL